ncbi:cbb3-type cytochrome oxidase assembly protein CcoS [Woodsholea maritima]|uniref:cbb3-type cytochrome oxidase assembly protein CcoS n=1 Tax=Woodsholea maritima TaxID=240237 RepID=UPI00037EC7B9|nr:cbb3-type cytochrome oxidase assembly protein CcoS [Woodsholea maritima]
MTALLWLMPAALALGVAGLIGFFWSVKSGQFDDLEGAAQRILIEEDAPIVEEPLDEGSRQSS